jgi:malonyl-CoA/methylmalonyl-CoA synthetase
VADSTDRPTDAEFRAWGKERLAPAKVPFNYLCIVELPRNPMGKVTKVAVKELFA